jgi:DNA-nicking Smr family endonuclease
MADPPRQRTPTPEELTLWRQAMRDAVPLRPRTEVVPAGVPEPGAPGGTPSSLVPTLAAHPVCAAPVAARSRPGLPPLELGQSSGLDRRTDERLRRGQLVIDGRIDLHGLTQSAAHDVLARFLDDSQRAGRRCVLVITGKGAANQGGGVLRNAAPRWLAEPGLRRLIIAIHRAQPQHGGDGALYVLLKRRRVSMEL